MRYALPKDTAEILQDKVGQNQNLSLALDRLQPINDETQDGEAWAKPHDQWRLTDEAKRGDKTAPVSLRGVAQLLKHANARRKRAINGLNLQDVSDFTATVDYGAVVGFGAEHVRETNLCLHRIYGFPMIPGSAVKGVTRAWGFWLIAEKLGLSAFDIDESAARKDTGSKTPLGQMADLLSAEEHQTEHLEELKRDDACQTNAKVQGLDVDSWRQLSADFQDMFGTTKKQGHVHFFDAYPKEARRLKVDILNPHYGEYYQSRTGSDGNPLPPADYWNPVPTFFLTVDKGTAFQFAVGSRNSRLSQLACGWLKSALANLGIGGKTAAGLGYFA